MLNEEETANVMQLLEDLQVDLRNGNIPAAKLLFVSLANCLSQKVPIEWDLLGNFISDHCMDAVSRAALLHLIPKITELSCPSQPDQDADTEC